jgi:predicted nucleotide-binding protein
MHRVKTYKGVIFSPEIIKEARDAMLDAMPRESGKSLVPSTKLMKLYLPDDEEWEYDGEEEFFAAYRNSFETAFFWETYRSGGLELQANCSGEGKYRRGKTSVKIVMSDREHIMRIFNIFEANIEKCKLPEIPSEEVIKPTIFIGHGHNNQWRDLKDHLHEKHDFEVEAYEIGARGGLTVQEVLGDMLTISSFALLVFTGEDEDAQGEMHARENVIHELGLFQGRLGWRRAIILLEEGVKEFSNIQGVNTIRFEKNSIREVYGEVLATIRREFG